jgi:hypothetical protein
MADDNVSLQEKAANAILPHVLYQPPEYLQALWDVLARPPVEWPREVQCWLRQADANFWNKHLPPPPPDNE